jgi:hypothetical protein
MTRTLPLVALMFIPIVLHGKHLYQWARYPTAATANALQATAGSRSEQALTANFKRRC